MAARAIWKAELKIGSNKIPVSLYSAVVDQDVHFRILEQRTKSPVKQHMIHPETGKEVPKEEIQKGYEIDPGTFVLLSEEELEKIKPKASREIEIIQFISPENIPSQFYDRPYFLAPGGDAKSYFALSQAVTKQEKVGIARWVMRDKEYLGALRAVDGYLMLITLRQANEVVSAKQLPSPEGRALDKKELSLAKQLVAMLEGEFDPAEFRDEYREKLMDFIKSKARGKAPKLRAIRPKRAPSTLDTVLSKSIATLKKEKKAA